MKKSTAAAGERANLAGLFRLPPDRLSSDRLSPEATVGETDLSAPQYDLKEIPPINIEKYLAYIRDQQVASWSNIPRTVKKEVLLRTCRERNRRHPLLMTFEDFAHTFRFLNNKTLTGFYNYFNSLCRGPRGMVIKCICEDLHIEITTED